MENLISGFILGVCFSLVIYLIAKEDCEPQVVDNSYYIETLERQIEQEQRKNEIYKLLLECKN